MAARRIVCLAVVASIAGAAHVAAAADAPRLIMFKSGGRIASGVVAKYDLRQESTDFEYRIRAQRSVVKVLKRSGDGWVTIGRTTARPPRPLRFWAVFRKMGVGRYRLVARAVSGSGAAVEQSKPKTIGFRVVAHIPHDD
jgi:hypothetical protein